MPAASPLIAVWDPDPQEPALIRQAKAFIAERLDDPALSPGLVAKAQGVSVRQVHRLFASTGSSLGDWVRQLRLARCAAALRDQNQAHESLTRIAFRWGFNDSAHFSRAFRSAFGQTPREYRSHHLKHGAKLSCH